MLHHVPSPRAQDRLFAEAHRVLRPTGVFRGTDSRDGWAFRLLHRGDVMVVVDPAAATERLTAAGFTDVRVDLPRRGTWGFLARSPTADSAGGAARTAVPPT
jgi:hypothetical protein